ncbi:MAG: sigma-54-dependent Fis family transcriptional regulator [Bacteroidales bacterium]|nr:sigma-54-dependent Fis family transcriptional regulator [Bacteroidales bacterium]
MDIQELQRIKNQWDIVGSDEALNRALETAVAIAPSDLSVLIQGESGTGKEAIPHIIHSRSLRKSGKFLAVNCGAIPEGTINAELFGHEKGSFTGAVGERKGYFEEADGGTIFLDEIGELPRETQAMLLRVLESGEFLKVGSSRVQKTNVRLIAATNVDLEHAVATGKFRRDLLYRLNAIKIVMPPLRERKNDIYTLFRKFSSDFSERYRLRKISLAHDAITLITAYRWPGNIRQLKNFAEAVTQMESLPATTLSDRIELDAAAIARYMPAEPETVLPVPAAQNADGGMSQSDRQMFIKALLDLKQEVDRLRDIVENGRGPVHELSPQEEPEEQSEAPSRTVENIQEAPMTIREQREEMILRTLEKHGGNVKQAAAELGISDRTIYRLIAARKGK